MFNISVDCNYSKITFLKEGTKKRQVYAPKEGFQKRTLAQNINRIRIE